jgi:hypothetical protein
MPHFPIYAVNRGRHYATEARFADGVKVILRHRREVYHYTLHGDIETVAHGMDSEHAESLQWYLSLCDQIFLPEGISEFSIRDVYPLTPPDSDVEVKRRCWCVNIQFEGESRQQDFFATLHEAVTHARMTAALEEL